jgi:hypothetical protein
MTQNKNGCARVGSFRVRAAAQHFTLPAVELGTGRFYYFVHTANKWI